VSAASSKFPNADTCTQVHTHTRARARARTHTQAPVKMLHVNAILPMHSHGETKNARIHDLLQQPIVTFDFKLTRESPGYSSPLGTLGVLYPN